MCKAIDDMIAEGKAEGKAEAVLVILDNLVEVKEEIRNKIYEQKNTEILNRWLCLAARTNTLAEFEAIM